MGKYAGHKNIIAIIIYQACHYQIKIQMCRHREAVYKLQSKLKFIIQIMVNTMIIKIKKAASYERALQISGKKWMIQQLV